LPRRCWSRRQRREGGSLPLAPKGLQSVARGGARRATPGSAHQRNHAPRRGARGQPTSVGHVSWPFVGNFVEPPRGLFALIPGKPLGAQSGFGVPPSGGRERKFGRDLPLRVDVTVSVSPPRRIDRGMRGIHGKERLRRVVVPRVPRFAFVEPCCTILVD